MESYRCFIAIDLPQQVKDELGEIQHKLSSWPVRVKWVEKQNFHITLKFLGDVALNRVDEVEAALKKVTAAHLKSRLSLGGLGAFPNLKRPKVIWVGVKDFDNKLYDIWADTEKELVNRGFAPEPKPFAAHLTLGRVKEDYKAPVPEGILPKVDVKQSVIPVDRIQLMRSCLTRNGPVYSCLGNFPLQEHFE